MKKTLIIAAALLTVLIAAGATVAWLTASASVSNTFTVGKIAIALDESTWTQQSKIYPGAEISKNPTVTVKANSEPCYVYVMVDNQLNDAVADAVSLDIGSDWTSISTSGTKTVYRYNDIVPLSASDQALTPLFTKVTVDSTVVTEANIGLLDGKAIDIGAYAHQSNATTQAAADAEALAHFGL